MLVIVRIFFFLGVTLGAFFAVFHLFTLGAVFFFWGRVADVTRPAIRHGWDCRGSRKDTHSNQQR